MFPRVPTPRGQLRRQPVGILALQLGGDHQPRRHGVVAGKTLGLEGQRNIPHLAPALQLHHPVGAPLRRAFWQWQPAGLLEDRSELAGFDVDGDVVSLGDLGERRAAEIGPGRSQCHVVIDGDGHSPPPVRAAGDRDVLAMRQRRGAVGDHQGVEFDEAVALLVVIAGDFRARRQFIADAGRGQKLHPGADMNPRPMIALSTSTLFMTRGNRPG